MTERRLIDLTMPISPGMPTNLPDHRPPEVVRYGRLESHGWEGSLVTIDTHCGTHVDAPKHFVAGASGIDKVPLEVLVGPATVLRAKSRGGQSIEVDQLPANVGKRLLLVTGSSALLTIDRDLYFSEYVTPSVELAEALVKAGTRLLAIDSPSVDQPGQDEVHHVLLENGVIIVENVMVPASLPDQIDLVVAPLPLVDVDGSPARAFAAVREGEH